MVEKIDGLEFSIDLDTSDLRAELNSLNGLGQSFGRTMVRSFAGAITSGRKFSDVLRSLALSLSRQALSAAIRPLGNALGGLFGNLFGSADGNAFSQGRIKPFANGGIVNSPTLFPMRGATGLMGEAGPEAILPLSRGPDGRLGVQASNRSGDVNITMNITSPDVAGFQKSQTQIAATMQRAIERGNRNL
jgi:lambda family phage tail tape measure protein